jgi:hypothetical protein
VREALECDRRDEHRHGDLGAEDGRGGAHTTHVDEHARARHPAVERRDVLAERPFVAGASGEVAVCAGVDLSAARRS